MTKEAFALLRNIPSLRHVPNSTLIAIIIALAVFGFLFLLLIIYLITDFVRIEREEHKSPDAHRLVADLQQTLIAEMRGTSRQNTLMIYLTVIFILISTFGIVIGVVGPKGIVVLAKNLLNTITGASKNVRLPIIR